MKKGRKKLRMEEREGNKRGRHEETLTLAPEFYI